jgi:ABC-type nitrate/sulfonate/bicarbonate transport system permease component
MMWVIFISKQRTLRSSDWQILKSVYFPSVISRLFDDLRVLTAISWTYIIVIETINSGEDGIGALIYTVGQRQVKVDRLYALLIIIILIECCRIVYSLIWIDNFSLSNTRQKRLSSHPGLKKKDFLQSSVSML